MSRSWPTIGRLDGDGDSAADPAGSWFAVAMTTSAVPVVCAAGVLDRGAVDELRGTLLAHLRHCLDGCAIICDLSQAQILEPAAVTRVLTDTAVRAARHLVRLLVLPCSGLATESPVTVPDGCAAATYALIDDMKTGLRRTCDLEHEDRQVRRILGRTIRHGLRDLRSQPPYDTLDPATCQALRWRLADAAHAGVDAGPHLLAAAAGVRRALTHLGARQHRDAYFALLTAEDHLAGRVEPNLPAPPSLPAPRAAGTPKPRSESGPGGTRGRVFVARQLPARRLQPAGDSR